MTTEELDRLAEIAAEAIGSNIFHQEQTPMFDDITLARHQDPTDDAKILAAFRKWIAAAEESLVLVSELDRQHAAGEIAHEGMEDPRWFAALDATDAVAVEVARMPISGAVGLAVKAYIAIQIWSEGHPSHPCALGDSTINASHDEVVLGLCDDLVRLVPELAPLTDTFMYVTEEGDDDDDEDDSVELTDVGRDAIAADEGETP
jgi:hypothetical protein